MALSKETRLRLQQASVAPGATPPATGGLRTVGRLASALAVGLAVIVAAPAAGASAFGISPSGSASQLSPSEALPPLVTTRHSITLDGERLDYTAVAEMLPLDPGHGAPNAALFTVSYLVAPKPGQPRPVTFVFNGGPGAASVFLHLGALGPRILDTPESGAVPPPPVRLVDNPSTWLKFTDLVFIDPVGTGYSHAEETGHAAENGHTDGKGGDPDKAFWNVRADLGSLAAVIRLWLTRHDRWDSSVWLVGESYGGFRAASLADLLSRDVGVTVSGLVLISPALDLAALREGEFDLVGAACALPSYAEAAAFFAGKPLTPSELAADERFALSDYLVGLAALKGVPAPGDALMTRVARLAGIPERIVRNHRGRIPRRVFAREIRRPEGEIVSLYDATVTQAAPPGSGGNGYGGGPSDPVLDPAIAAYTAAFNVYAPRELGYRTLRPYRVLPRIVSRQWNWHGTESGNGYGSALAALDSALLAHPTIKVLIVDGRYDLVAPFLLTRWLVDQMALPPAARARIRLRVYPGGHMMYMRPQSRARLAGDAAALYAAPVAVPAAPAATLPAAPAPKAPVAAAPP